MNDKVKKIFLVMLVIMAIWQTSELWLGDMPSLSYFMGQNNDQIKAIAPDSIWMNPGAPATTIYRLGEENREYQSVKNEIEELLNLHTRNAGVSDIKSLNWEEILSKKGILFEYPFDISYKEMIGSFKRQAPKNFPLTDNIDYVFLELSKDTKNLASWQIISSKSASYVSLEIPGDFENIHAFNDLLKQESVLNKVKYQPTYNMSGLNKSNMFLPIASEDSPLYNDLIEYKNPLEDVKDFSEFNPYINHYFINPLLKKEEIVSGDTYVFSELMKTVVTYYPSGVFEYSNIDISSNHPKTSRLQAYNIAKDFLQANESLKKEIKNKLFLSKIIERENGYEFFYDIKIKGIPVYFSEETRENLKMDHMARITLVGDQISNFKWINYDFKTKNLGDKVKTKDFNVKYTDALNSVLEKVAKKGSYESLAIDNMKWVYMLENEKKLMDVEWIIKHEGKWYSP